MASDGAAMGGRLALRLAMVGVLAAVAVGVVTMTVADGAGSPGCAGGWTCEDVGSPTPAGGQTFTSGSWTVHGGGADIWGTADSFHFAWRPLASDGTVSARVVSQTDTDQNAKAGVMVRASSVGDSAYYAVLVTPQHGLVVQFRPAAGRPATNAGGRSATAPLSVRILRVGSTYTAYTSTDGATWTKVSGSAKVVPGLFGPVEAGMAVTSHHPDVTGTAVFTTAQVSPTPPEESTTSSSPTTTSAPSDTSTLPTTTDPGSTTTTTTTAGGGSGSGAAPSTARVVVCGTSLCVDGAPWSMYGSTIYNPGLTPYRSGIRDPAGTVALAEQAHLNTIRITDFLDVTGDPSTDPYDPARWASVDAMIAAAGTAGLHVDLGLADYRALLWNRCVDPYTTDWGSFISFVANRVNTVNHRVYKDDPTIAFVSAAGEPLPVGTHRYTAKTTGAPCTVSYSTADLTAFYASVTRHWQHQGGTVLFNSGGLGYLNEPSSGIDWRSIFSLPSNAFCDIKTYGGMQAWAPTAASYCRSIGKPLVVEEFGWQQGAGDAFRAQLVASMVAQLRSLQVAGMAFWNLGYQLASTSYEIGPATPLTFSAVIDNAP